MKNNKKPELLSKLLVILAVVSTFAISFWAITGHFVKPTIDNAVVYHEELASPLPTPTPVPVQKLSGSFIDKRAGFKLTFPGTMYVARSDEQGYYNSPLKHGMIQIGRNSDFEKSGIQIEYGIPELSEKGGGGCSHYPSDFRLNGAEATSSCFEGEYYVISYPINPNQKIQYGIFIGGTKAERDEYLKILQNGITWL